MKIYKHVLRQLSTLLLFFACLSQSALAETILPPLLGTVTTAIVAEKNAPRLPVGTVVEFIGTNEAGIPKPLGVYGSVLGLRDAVVFFELSSRAAVVLANARNNGPIKFKIHKQADPEFIADRWEINELGLIAYVAPRMRTLTLSVTVEKEAAEAWERGDRLVFLDAGETKRYNNFNGKMERNTHISASFVSATSIGSSRYEVTVIADPDVVDDLLRGSAKGSLSLSPNSKKKALTATPRKRCTIRQLHGGERITIEIPCVD